MGAKKRHVTSRQHFKTVSSVTTESMYLCTHRFIHFDDLFFGVVHRRHVSIYKQLNVRLLIAMRYTHTQISYTFWQLATHWLRFLARLHLLRQRKPMIFSEMMHDAHIYNSLTVGKMIITSFRFSFQCAAFDGISVIDTRFEQSSHFGTHLTAHVT